MNAFEVGTKLVELIRANDMETIYRDFYSPAIISIEPTGEDRESVGMAAVQAKNEWWSNNMEVHGWEVSGPWPHGDSEFALKHDLDITEKNSGHRYTMSEIAVYEVQDGRIVRERFFYHMGG